MGLVKSEPRPSEKQLSIEQKIKAAVLAAKKRNGPVEAPKASGGLKLSGYKMAESLPLALVILVCVGSAYRRTSKNT